MRLHFCIVNNKSLLIGYSLLSPSLSSYRITMAADWQLQSCCNTEEIVFIVLLVVYFVINFLLWNTFILKPMKVRVWQ